MYLTRMEAYPLFLYSGFIHTDDSQGVHSGCTPISSVSTRAVPIKEWVLLLKMMKAVGMFEYDV